MGSRSRRKRPPGERSGAAELRAPAAPAPEAKRSRSGHVLALAALAVAAVVAVTLLRERSERADPAPPAVSGTASMTARLRKIAEETSVDADVFANDRRAARFEERLRVETDPTRRVQLLGLVGYEQLLAGRTTQAIESLGAQIAKLRELGLDAKDPAVVQMREFLAIAHMRLGEQENCLALHGPESCLLPLAGGGVHQAQRGARQAIAEYRSLLQDFPEDLGYRWLLNLATMAVGEYPDGVDERWRIPPSTFESEVPFPRFPNVAQALGVNAMSTAGGSVVEDLDGDGLLDIVACGWSLSEPVRVFRSNGDGTFTDRARDAGLEGLPGGLNLVQADYDNDGDPDLLVLRGAWRLKNGHHPVSLLRNDGAGRFEDVTEAAGLLRFHPTQAAVWADFDGDGWLDLFLGNESTPGDPHPCELFRNDGRGRFRDVAREVGLAHVGWVKGAAAADYDDDGLVDLYLSRYQDWNVLFHNDGGKFTDVTAAAGVAGPRMSFPTWFFDHDNDGDEDLLVASFFNAVDGTMDTLVGYYLGGPAGPDHVCLYRNDGGGKFTEVSGEAGIDEPLLAMGSNFGDLDNDGWLDCYFGTGDPNLATLVPNRMYRNLDGRRFADVTTAGGFGHLQKGHGVSFGDLDNDGDQDVYTVLGGAFSGDVAPNALFLNPGSGNRWVTLVLEGTRANRSAIGARIAVRVEGPSGPRTIRSTVGTGGSFGASSLQQELGLGDAARIVEVEVRWPGDSTPQAWRDVPMERFVRLTQGSPRFVEIARRELSLAVR